MDPIWFKPDLSEEIMKNDELFDFTQSVVADILSNRLDITLLVENMAGVLTNKDSEQRAKGMRFFTKILKELPNHYLSEEQTKFISKFYIDRLKDTHSVIPPVLEGYVALINMKNYNIYMTQEFFIVLFREVVCQSQTRQDRYHIYLIMQTVMERDVEFMKTRGPDFVYGVISAMDGERDPRNLLFLFKFLPRFIANMPLGHLTEEMFDVISCYYPIDFHPNPGDPAAVTRQELANALAPCLCATPDFGEQCLIMLIEKLDSSLLVAKLDSLRLLAESCKTFTVETYSPFLKALWSSIRREISHKTDETLKMAAHEALFALVKKLSTTANTDKTFETFIEGILIAMQTQIAESTTAIQFVQAAKVLLTAANSSKESCKIIAGAMIPATIAFYGFKSTPKLRICSLGFLGDLYELAKHWEIVDLIYDQVKEIPQHCLTVCSEQNKEYQIAGFKTLSRVKDILDGQLVLPFVEILIHNVQHANDTELLTVSVNTVHHIAQKYPEEIMSMVVKGKCDLNNLTADKTALKERLNLLSNLLSIDDFTKIIIEEMLKLIASSDMEAPKIVEALSESMSNSSLYSDQKVTQIESDHNLINSVISWLFAEIESTPQESLAHGYTLISNTISSLPAEKQLATLEMHTQPILDRCKNNNGYFLILESLYNAVQSVIFTNFFPEILALSLKFSLTCDNELIRQKSCVLVAHLLNKAEYGPDFEFLYEFLKNYLSSCNGMDTKICPRLIRLYGWITKALVMRGSDLFLFWLQKISSVLTNEEYCKDAADAIRLIMTSQANYLSTKHHCRISLLYKQRMFVAFAKLSEKIESIPLKSKESYLLCWAFVIEKAPKSVLNSEVTMISPLIVDSLDYDNKDLLLVMTDVLVHFVQSANPVMSDSLQTILPRLVRLTKYVKSMDVRIKSLQCLYEIANTYRTSLLLPYKQDILIDLAPSLDDNKRLVRNMAVKSRTRWFLIGAPGEAKEN